MAVRMGKQGHQATVLLVISHKTVEIHIEHGICVQQKKILSQLIFDPKQRTVIPQGFFFKKVGDRNTKGFTGSRRDPCAVTEIVRNNMPQMAYRNDDVGEPLIPQTLDLMLQHRLPVDLNHRLGDITGHRGNTGTPATSHDNSFQSVSPLGM